MTVENLEIKVKTDADQAAAKLTSLSNALGRVQSSAKSVSGNTNGAAKGIKNVGEAAKKANAPLGNFISSLKRIAFYRIIRGIIKSITQAFSDGLQWAYQFSNGIVTEGHRFAEALDSMKTAGSTMKAQLGSSFIGLLAAVAPVINQIILLVTRLADALSQIFAAFTGTTYLKAAEVPQKWADAAGKAGRAAKEWKNQLLGFDEINRLNEPSSGGGGGSSGVDPSQMFNDTPLSEWAQKLHDILANLTLSFDNIFFKWENLTPEDIAQKVITGLAAVAGGIIGFALGGPGGAVLGMTIGAGLGVVISSLIFNNDGKIDENEFVSMIIAAMGGIGGAIIGFSIGGVAGAALGFILGVSISLVLQKMNWLNPVKGQSKEVVQEYLNGVKESFNRATPGTYEASYFDRWKRYAERQMEEAGTASADGFDKGVDGEFTVLGWLKKTWEKIVDNVKTSFGIHSPSTVFADIGVDIVDGLWNGISSVWDSFSTWFSNIFGGLISWCQTAHNYIQDVINGIGIVNSMGGSKWNSGDGLSGRIGKFASGGFPDEGQLFIANEAGAELVGSMNGRAAVANNDQIIEGIRQGVYDAVVAANSGDRDISVRVYLDSKEIKAGQQRLDRAWGV